MGECALFRFVVGIQVSLTMPGAGLRHLALPWRAPSALNFFLEMDGLMRPGPVPFLSVAKPLLRTSSGHGCKEENE